MLRWRADLLAALRARWLLLVAWTALVALTAAGAIMGDWWRPVASGDIVVASGADARTYLRDFDDERDLSTVDTGATGSDDDGGGGRDLSSLVSGGSHCTKLAPFEHEVSAEQAVGHPFVLGAVDARHAAQLEIGAGLEPVRASGGTRFVEVVLTARNTGDDPWYPAGMFALVTGDGKVHLAETEPFVDRIGRVQPGAEMAGVLVFRVPAAYPNTGGRMVIVVGLGVRSPGGALQAVEEGRCGRINAATTGVVGDSPRVEGGRLIGGRRT